jgi:hypothetical protein
MGSWLDWIQKLSGIFVQALNRCRIQAQELTNREINLGYLFEVEEVSQPLYLFKFLKR